jgi:hypothetical protein
MSSREHMMSSFELLFSLVLLSIHSLSLHISNFLFKYLLVLCKCSVLLHILDIFPSKSNLYCSVSSKSNRASAHIQRTRQETHIAMWQAPLQYGNIAEW